MASALGVQEEGVLLAQALANPPAAVAHEEGVEHVARDVERVVDFEEIAPARVGFLHDGAGKQHAHGLAADQAGADHAAADLDHVVQREMLLRKLQDAVVAGDRHAQQTAEHLPGLFLDPLVALQGVEHLLRVDEGAGPRAETVTGAVEREAPAGGQDFGVGVAVEHGIEGVAVAGVHHVHGGRRAVLHLEGVDVVPAVVAMHVDENLGRVADGAGRVDAVVIAQQAEIGHGVEVVEVGTR